MASGSIIIDLRVSYVEVLPVLVATDAFRLHVLVAAMFSASRAAAEARYLRDCREMGVRPQWRALV